MPASNDKSIIALDVGTKRIGVAVATLASRLPKPLKTIENTPDIFIALNDVIQEQAATTLVVGLPRNLDGDDTPQTKLVREFVQELEAYVSLPVYLQDEALTSQKAEQELHDRGVPYNKGEVDALAATYILSDFLSDHPEV